MTIFTKIFKSTRAKNESKFDKINSYLKRHQSIVNYDRENKIDFESTKEFHYLLHYITEHKIIKFSEFKKIYDNRAYLLYKLELEKKNPMEVAHNKCGMETAQSNLQDLEKIIKSRINFYKLCLENNIEPNLAIESYLNKD